MRIERLTMTDVTTPLSLSEYYPTIPGATQGDITQPHIPATQSNVHDIFISGVTAANPQTVRTVTSSGGLIIGLPEAPMRNVFLDDISITSASTSGTYTRLRNLDGLACRNVTVTPLHATAPNAGHTFDNESGLTNITGCDVAAPSM
jgi:polygalacturonase